IAGPRELLAGTFPGPGRAGVLQGRRQLMARGERELLLAVEQKQPAGVQLKQIDHQRQDAGQRLMQAAGLVERLRDHLERSKLAIAPPQHIGVGVGRGGATLAWGLGHSKKFPSNDPRGSNQSEIGSRNQKVLPAPSALSTPTAPPCSST